MEAFLIQVAPIQPSAISSQKPSLREVLAMAGVACLVFMSVIRLFKGYSGTVDNFADSAAYMSVASAIRHWNFQGLVVKQLWGLPYFMAAISTLESFRPYCSAPGFVHFLFR